ncbi:MAG: DUF2970 domain-containing protein [Casimicrobium sp.]
MRSFLSAIVAVMSAFIGIRKRGAAHHDQQLKPLHFIVAALLCVAILVALLIAIVRTVIA